MKLYQRILFVLFLFATSSRCGSGLDLGFVEATSSGLTCSEIRSGPYYISTRASVNSGPDRLERLNDTTLLIVRTNYSLVDSLNLSTGVSTIFAGTGSAGFSGDSGSATAAQINAANGIVKLPGGDILIADTSNHRLRRISGGVINTVAGDGSATHVTNAFGISASFSSPRGLAMSEDGQSVYIVDSGNHCVRKMRLSDYYVTDLAGTCGSPGLVDGAPGAALYNNPYDISVYGSYAYVVDYFNHTIRRVRVSDGYTETYAGSTGGGSGFTDGARLSALFTFPQGIDIDDCGYLYIADRGNNAVRRVLSDRVETIGGDGSAGSGGDGGLATNAQIDSPYDVEVISDRIYVSGHTNNLIRVLDLDP